MDMKHKRSVKATIGLFVLTVLLLVSNWVALAVDPSWVTKAPMMAARYSFQTEVINGKIYSIGGYSGSNALSSVEMYDPTTNTWTTQASMSTARYDFQSAVVNGKIYVFGCRNSTGFSSSVEAYDPVTNTWTSRASMPTARSRVQIEVIDGKVYVIGGMNSSGSLSVTEVYDPVANTWTTRASMSIARINFQAELIDGKIYAISGSNTEASKSVEMYDPATNTWTTRASLSTGRANCATEVIDGKIYAMGGHNGTASESSSEAYDPTSNTWTALASMSTAREGVQSEVINGKIYAIGGANGTTYYSIAEMYDPASNIWTTLNSLSNASIFPQLKVINGIIYAIGGYNGASLSAVEAYTPVTLPPAPSLTATPGDAQVTLNWNSVTDATSYNVYRATASGGPYTQIATGVTGTSYIDTNVTGGTTYYYVVTAVSSVGESAYSNEASATPVSSWNGLLKITMTTGAQKEYDLTSGQINAFIEWFNSDAEESPYYTFTKTYNVGTLTSRKDNIAFSKIAFFEVMAYGEDSTPTTPTGTNTALLKVTMLTGDIMEYEVTDDQLSSFTDWYGGGAAISPTFAISKAYNLGPFLSRTDYLVYNKIVDFEVLEY